MKFPIAEGECGCIQLNFACGVLVGRQNERHIYFIKEELVRWLNL